jgi:hypothetical protein
MVKEVAVAYRGIFVEGLKETTTDLSQNGRYAAEIRTGSLRNIAG